MDWTSGFPWLSTLKSRRDGGFVEADFADMGTAFGLDANMPPPDECPTRPPRQAGAQEPWERRMVRRCEL